MDSKEKYKYWLEVATYDLETAKVMLSGGRYVYVAFMCQQAIEKLTKGIFTLHTGNEPPMTHNIWYLFKCLKKDIAFDNEFEVNLNKYKSFFAQLLAYYISGRYPNFKEKVSESLDAHRAKRIMTVTEEVFRWIESLSQYK